MAAQVAINGSGRIGRCMLRAAHERPGERVAVPVGPPAHG